MLQINSKNKNRTMVIFDSFVAPPPPPNPDNLLLEQLEAFVKNSVFPSFLDPYGKKDYKTIQDNVTNGTFQNYLNFVQAKKYDNISIASLIDKALHLVTEGVKSAEDIITLTDTVIKLEKEIIDLEIALEECRKRCKKSIFEPTTAFNIETEMEVKVNIKDAYVLYLEKYGFPDDGVFDPDKLAEFEPADPDGDNDFY